MVHSNPRTEEQYFQNAFMWFHTRGPRGDDVITDELEIELKTTAARIWRSGQMDSKEAQRIVSAYEHDQATWHAEQELAYRERKKTMHWLNQSDRSLRSVHRNLNKEVAFKQVVADLQKERTKVYWQQAMSTSPKNKKNKEVASESASWRDAVVKNATANHSVKLFHQAKPTKGTTDNKRTKEKVMDPGNLLTYHEGFAYHQLSCALADSPSTPACLPPPPTLKHGRVVFAFQITEEQRQGARQTRQWTMDSEAYEDSESDTDSFSSSDSDLSGSSEEENGGARRWIKGKKRTSTTSVDGTNDLEPSKTDVT